MHSIRLHVTCAMAAGSLLHGCASMTVIHTVPEGAKVYADGEFKGQTPYSYSDQKIVGSTTHLRLVKDGYQETNAALQRNEEFSVGACIGGALVLVPFLWSMNYKPEHRYELVLAQQQSTPVQRQSTEAPPPAPSRAADAGQ